MENLYKTQKNYQTATTTTNTGYEIANPIISLGQWEFALYLVMAFVLGYLIHYIFSSRRDYVRSPKRKRNAYYSNTEPIYPTKY